jgi:hypothetical protein
MLSPPKQPKSYADRPATPLGDATGLTSTPVSEQPSRKNTPPPGNPYHYQPAIASTRPEIAILRRSSSNYIQACSPHIQTEVTSPGAGGDGGVGGMSDVSSVGEPGSPGGSGRSFSFSAEDLKRSKYQHLMKEEDHEEGKEGVKSPGIGNSEVKGRDFGFSSVE